MSSVKKRPNGKWRARYRDPDGKEHARHFPTKKAGQDWLDEVTTSVLTGQYIDPKKAKTTVGEWCDTWIAGYHQRPRSITQAKAHVKRIKKRFGARPLSSVKPSDIRAWMGELRDEGLAASTLHVLHGRLSQVFSDAVHDGLIPRSPASRRTAPGAGKKVAYVATTEQVWALHDALPENLRGIVLLGAFAGLRRGEMVALRVADVDFMRGIITPAIQYPHDPLKTDASKTPIPIPRELALELNRMPAKWRSETIIVNEKGGPITPNDANDTWQVARAKVAGLPAGFRIHDLRHYFASMLIAAGLDVKVVQARLRHASAMTTLDVYGHLWPDSDESSRAAVAAVFEQRPIRLADSSRTQGAGSQ